MIKGRNAYQWLAIHTLLAAFSFALRFKPMKFPFKVLAARTPNSNLSRKTTITHPCWTVQALNAAEYRKLNALGCVNK
jgi:hypothetical protein